MTKIRIVFYCLFADIFLYKLCKVESVSSSITSFNLVGISANASFMMFIKECLIHYNYILQYLASIIYVAFIVILTVTISII